MSSDTYICIPCRFVTKSVWGANCPKCREPMKNMGTHWRAPKKSNERAWRLIEQGKYLWDEKAVARADGDSVWGLIHNLAPRLRTQFVLRNRHRSIKKIKGQF